MRTTMTTTEARVRFGELMHRVVERGETVIVTHRGTPKVVFISVAEYERLTGAWIDELLDRTAAKDDR